MGRKNVFWTGTLAALLCLLFSNSVWAAPKGKALIGANFHTFTFKTDRAKNVMGLIGDPVQMVQIQKVYTWSNWNSGFELDEFHEKYLGLNSYGIPTGKSVRIDGTRNADQSAWFVLIDDGTIRQLDPSYFAFRYDGRTMKKMPKGSIFGVDDKVIQYGYYSDPPPPIDPEDPPVDPDDPPVDPEDPPVDPVDPPPVDTIGQITFYSDHQVIQFQKDVSGNLYGLKPLVAGSTETINPSQVVKVYPYSIRLSIFINLTDIGTLHSLLRTFSGTLNTSTLQATMVKTADNDQCLWFVLLTDGTLRQLDPTQFEYAYDPVSMQGLTDQPIQQVSTGQTTEAMQYGLFTQPQLVFDSSTYNIVGWFNENQLANMMEPGIELSSVVEVCWNSYWTGYYENSTVRGFMDTDEFGHHVFIILANPGMLIQDNGFITLRRKKADGAYVHSSIDPREWAVSSNASVNANTMTITYDFSQPLQ